MKLKYYIRGLGIGILMATVVMLVVTNNKMKTMTDTEVIARATQLGMVMKSDTVSDAINNGNVDYETEKSTEEITSDELKEKTDIQTEDGDGVTENAELKDESKKVEDPSNGEIETVSLTIVSGTSSEQVSRQLVSIGVITDAKGFDEYLYSKGFDSKIRVGDFSIPLGSTNDEIAEIITKSP